MIDLSTEVSVGAMLMIYGAVESAKVLGVPEMVKSAITGKRSCLTDGEAESFKDHFEQCRGCVKCQDEQVRVLRQISDTLIRVETRLGK